MGSQNSSDQMGVLLEQIIHQNQVILENLSDMHVKIDTRSSQESLDEVKQDIQVVKHAITDTSSQVDNHEQRLNFLEQAV